MVVEISSWYVWSVASRTWGAGLREAFAVDTDALWVAGCNDFHACENVAMCVGKATLI